MTAATERPTLAAVVTVRQPDKGRHRTGKANGETSGPPDAIHFASGGTNPDTGCRARIDLRQVTRRSAFVFGEVPMSTAEDSAARAARARAAAQNLTPAHRSSRARIASLARWSKAPAEERIAQAERAQAGLLDRFRREALEHEPHLTEPELSRKAEYRRALHMERLSLKARKARRDGDRRERP